ncbi:MAG: hypothetical protein ACREJG_05835 [Candidatus Rokuibacteriota bacterium]
MILLFGGLELATGVPLAALERQERYVTVFTAGVSMWNMGAGYVAGLALWLAVRRQWVRA